MDRDGSNLRQVTQFGERELGAVLHARRQAHHLRVEHEGSDAAPNFDLYLINLDGTGLEQVTFSRDFDGFPMFSPDGTKLVFASNRHDTTRTETNMFIADWVK